MDFVTPLGAGHENIVICGESHFSIGSCVEIIVYVWSVFALASGTDSCLTRPSKAGRLALTGTVHVITATSTVGGDWSCSMSRDALHVLTQVTYRMSLSQEIVLT